MRRTSIALFGVLLTFAAATRAEAQCAKRILVYLDTSGSMLKAQGKEGTPYQKTLAALGKLFQDQSFFEPGDTVQIEQFGQTTTPPAKEQGPSRAANLLERLGTVKPSLDTNFDAVFDDLQKTLDGATQFDRQVVIIASDFAHDPASTPPKAEPNLTDWNAVWDRRKADLTSRFAAASKLPLVLFRSPASGWEEKVQSQVLKDLSTIVAPKNSFNVGAGGSSAEELAAGIKHALLFDPVVMPGLDPAHLDTLLITVKNLNCIPVDLASVKLICPAINGAPQGASIPVPIGAGQSRLERRGANDTQVLKIPKSTVPCGDDYEVAAETVQGAAGSAKATNRTWMKYKVEKILFEENLLSGSVVHLILGLQGLSVDERSYSLTLEATARGGKVQVAGTVAAPRNLDPGTAKRYRVTMPVTKSVRDRFLEAREVEVRIDGVEPLDKSATQVPAEKEEPQSWSNGAQLIEGPLLFCLFLFAVFYRKSTIRDAMGFATETGEVVKKGWAILLGTVPWIDPLVNILRPPFTRALPLSLADGVKEASIFLALFLGVSLSGRAIGTSQLIRDVYLRRLHDPEKYAKRVKAGWWPWVYGLVFASAVLASIHYFTPKSETGPIAEIQSLDVVPD